MTTFLLNLLLALLWAALHQFRPIDLVSGFIIGYGLLLISREWLGDGAKNYSRKMPTFIRFVLYYFKELFASTWEVTVALFSDQSKLKPGIIDLPLDAKTDFEIVLLHNLIFFTPGTYAMRLSPDKKTLYVHIIDVPDIEVARNKLKNELERRLLELLR